MDFSIVTILLDMFTKKKILLDKSTNLATNVILKKKLKVALTFRKKKKKKKSSSNKRFRIQTQPTQKN